MSELEKWADAQPGIAVITEFLDWCAMEKIELAKWNENGRWLNPLSENQTEVLTRYFEIDPITLENERRKFLMRLNSPSAQGKVGSE